MEKRIGFGPRLGAYLIDIVFIWILSSLVSRIVPTLFAAGAQQQIGSILSSNPMVANIYTGDMLTLLESIVRISLVCTVVEAVYYLTEIFFGASLGKMLLKLKIVDVEGQSASIGLLVGRYLLKHISTMCTLVAFFCIPLLFNSLGSLLGFVIFIGCFFAAGDKHQALHDLMCRTIVVRKNASEEN
jgi:uncharacterized RDD family membrane protein YckC